MVARENSSPRNIRTWPPAFRTWLPPPHGFASAAITFAASIFLASRSTRPRSAKPELIVFYLPMHTATRIGVAMGAGNPCAKFQRDISALAVSTLRSTNRICARPDFPRSLVPNLKRIWSQLAEELSHPERFLHQRKSAQSEIPRLAFEVPDRSGLPALRKYAHVVLPDGTNTASPVTPKLRAAANTSAVIAQLCRFTPANSASCRKEVVLADIRQQVAAGAQHITFGDPDFFNGITHATRIVEALARRNTRSSLTTSPSRSSTCSVTPTLLANSRSNRMPLHHQRRRITRRSGPAQTRKGSHSRRFLSRTQPCAEAGTHLAADVHPVHSLDHACQLFRSS